MSGSSINKYRAKLEQLKGQRQSLQKQLERNKLEQKENKKSLRRHEKAAHIIKSVALQTQSQLCYNVSEITSMALQAVLDDPYEIELEFVERRNKTECDIQFTRDGNSIDPFFGGGGAIDIAAFALRVALWSMQSPRTRNVLVLDEPFKHLKGEDANRKVLAMVKELSERLNIQIIMVSDERVSREATEAVTDRLFETTIKNGISQVNQIL